MSGTVIGLKNLHFALLTKDDSTGATYSAPQVLAPFISAKITTNVSNATLFADDQAIESASAVGQTDVELTIKDLPSDLVNTILGVEKNADGVLVHKSNITPPTIGLIFEATKSNGEKRLIQLCKGQFYLPDTQYDTKNDKVAFQSTTIKGTFVSRVFDGVFKYQADSDDTGLGANVVSGWYTAMLTTA